jgi:hypothetical protein
MSMNIRARIAVAALLFSAIASPSFATVIQFGVGADPVTDGRYPPPVITSSNMIAVPADARAQYVRPGRAAIPRTMVDTLQNDRLLQGHN